MAKTPTAEKKKPAKKPAKKASAKKVAAAVEGAEGEAPVPKKPRAKKVAAPNDTGPVRIVAMHGELRITHTGEPDSERAVAAIGRLVDEVHALGRVQVTSAAHVGATTNLHIVLPGHPQPYEQYPGLILSIDALDNLVTFDHVTIGLVTPELIDDAAFTMLGAMKGDNDNPANDIGRRADWFDRAVDAADLVGARHVAA